MGRRGQGSLPGVRGQRHRRASETHPEKNRGRANTEIEKSKSALPTDGEKSSGLKCASPVLSPFFIFYNRLNTLCINGDFGKIWRKDMPAAKGSVPDVRGEIRQQVLREMI